MYFVFFYFSFVIIEREKNRYLTWLGLDQIYSRSLNHPVSNRVRSVTGSKTLP